MATYAVARAGVPASPVRSCLSSTRTRAVAGCPMISSRSAVKHSMAQRISRGRVGVLHCKAAAAAAGGGSSDDEALATTPNAGGSAVENSKPASSLLGAFWKFLRPHTIRGTVLGTTMVVTRALMGSPEAIDWSLLPRALCGLLALLCGNGYIVGINQIYDVDIDAVNKPFLPVAAGELSPTMAWILCAALAAGGIGIVAANFGSLITSLYSFGLFLGTIYSVPPLRLKRFAVPAFLIIATVRGLLLNFGVFHATRAAIGLPFIWSPAIMFITAFSTTFAVVIAITKDLPDVMGDKKYGIKTFATELGVAKLSWAAIGLLLSAYAGAIYCAFSMSSEFRVPVMAGAHAVAAAVLLFRGWKLHQEKYSQAAILSFYRWIWNLFYSEYALLPFL